MFNIGSFQTKAQPVKQRLFALAETNDVNGLRRLADEGGEDIDWNADNGAMNLMQMAVSRGSREVKFDIKRCFS